MRNIIQKSILNDDQWVVVFRYRDSNGNLTNRVVSPIRFLGDNRFLGLCLSREEPRQFYFDRCEDVQLRPAWDYVMPVAM